MSNEEKTTAAEQYARAIRVFLDTRDDKNKAALRSFNSCADQDAAFHRYSAQLQTAQNRMIATLCSLIDDKVKEAVTTALAEQLSDGWHNLTPEPVCEGSQPSSPPGYAGLSAADSALRDRFAAAALTGLLGGRRRACNPTAYARFADAAYDIADAMLERRSVRRANYLKQEPTNA